MAPVWSRWQFPGVEKFEDPSPRRRKCSAEFSMLPAGGQQGAQIGQNASTFGGDFYSIAEGVGPSRTLMQHWCSISVPLWRPIWDRENTSYGPRYLGVVGGRLSPPARAHCLDGNWHKCPGVRTNKGSATRITTIVVQLLSVFSCGSRLRVFVQDVCRVEYSGLPTAVLERALFF